MFLDPSLVEPLGPHNFVTEASTVGIAPGQWPELLATTLGNGRHLYAAQVLHALDGSIERVVYAQACGCIRVTVFND